MNVGPNALLERGLSRGVMRTVNAGSVVFGGLFLGFWLFVAVFGTRQWWRSFDVLAWSLWGFLGLVVAGGILALRVTNEGVRLGLLAATGIAVGLLIGAALLLHVEEASGALLTFLGGALILSSLSWDAPDGDPEPRH